jgi:hypothetical protein
MKRAFHLVLISITLVACAQGMRGELEKMMNAYGDLVRLNKMELTGSFTTGALMEEFRARVQAAKNVRVVDYRVAAVKFDEEKGEAEALVEIDYYTLSAYRLKSLVDTQKWAYVDEGGKRQWKLVSLLPEFK